MHGANLIFEHKNYYSCLHLNTELRDKFCRSLPISNYMQKNLTQHTCSKILDPPLATSNTEQDPLCRSH